MPSVAAMAMTRPRNVGDSHIASSMSSRMAGLVERTPGTATGLAARANEDRPIVPRTIATGTRSWRSTRYTNVMGAFPGGSRYLKFRHQCRVRRITGGMVHKRLTGVGGWRLEVGSWRLEAAAGGPGAAGSSYCLPICACGTLL